MAYTTIKKPSDYFNTKLYTGNGTAGTDITGVGFQPDLVWIKSRSAAGDHALQDVVRGATKDLESNNEGAEQNRSLVQAFISDGFTLGTGQTNSNGDTFASWNWLASNTTGSSNTDGSITSTVSANTTSGFSIVSYTGTGTQPSTVGHGLGVTPKMFIVKPRTDAQSWCVYHESVGAGYLTYLDITSASGGSSVWNSTSPTSSVFTVNDNQVNSSGITYIAYCFAEVKGFSKFGSYTGNGNADGTFVYTGFKPAFTMIKRTDTTSDWNIMDNKRAVSFNPNTKELYANSSQAEATGGQTIRDFLSNGFKLRGTSGGTNASGGTYIYMAFAEEPLVGDNPATAR
jgi:hypothetical protein